MDVLRKMRYDTSNRTRRMNRKKILYAEDEYTNRKLVEINMKQYGIYLDLAKDGDQAMDLMKKNTYDLVILDQYMPGMNGTEIACEIRKTHSVLPIIGITCDEEQVPVMMEAGFNSVLIKPLSNEKYAYIIEKFLQ